MALTAGTRLGPYEILAHIGAGGMGEVWKATDTRLGRVVAIKVLNGAHSDRFEQEARAIAALNHPHICTLHDVGPDYLVMEYIEGSPLKGPLPVDEAVRLAVQIASALEAAHGKGILHRDLKPGNVLVTATGAKLLDFGLAKLTADGDATQTVGISGTPLYMSPEQAEGKVLDATSDVFSFGAVLYELLSGRRAFDSLGAVLRDEPAPLESPVADIVKRCLSKQAAGRFHSMAEVRAALDRIATKSATGHQPSIAVLPFANMSADKENEYFSDGLAEEIINALTKVPGLRVIARTSAFRFRGEQDLRKVGETLRVGSVLEGSVRKSGTRLRITAQLINVADDSHIWSERYDREMTDVFAIQDEISHAIVETLKLKLSPQAAAKPRYTPKLPAYEAYLKARYYHWKLTPEAMEQAKQFYEQAIALDPRFALAHAFYADLFTLRASIGITPAHEAMPAARAVAQRALELDPSLPEAHAILCAFAVAYDYDWKEAAHRFTLATADAAASPWVLAYLAVFYLLALGRRTEAIEQVERAVQGDPLDFTIRAVLAHCLAAAGRYTEAEGHLRQILDFDANVSLAFSGLASQYAAQRMSVEALPFAEKAHSMAPWAKQSRGLYAGLLIRAGEPDRGKELIQRLGSGEVYGTPIGLAIFHTCCGEIDLAADWIERAIEERFPSVAYWLQTAIAEPLRASPRWPKLAALMNLPASVS
jgi:TolB-like protein/tetratricopeptide (TPR) repeat protein